MRAITIHQPYAALIMAGTKTSETRSWRAPSTIIGERIAIHASRQLADWWGAPPAVVQAMATVHDDIAYGAVLGTVRVGEPWQVTVRVKPGSKRVWGFTREDYSRDQANDGLGDYGLGRWVWPLTDPQLLPQPIPAKGRQRIWMWSTPLVLLEGVDGA